MFGKLLRNPLLYIFLLGLILRIYKLGTFPAGFHVDEVKVGWNAYSILKTGADDWGNKISLYYNTFGDFRPTGTFYLTIPSIAILGLTEFAVRFPSALLGSLTILSIYFMVKEIDKRFALAAGFMLAILPWHISLSRTTSEGIVALFLVITGLYFFIKGYKKNTKYFIISLLFLFISYFFYHSARLLTPILTLILSINLIIKDKINIKTFKPTVIILFILFALTLAFSLSKSARARLSQVSIFNDLNVQHFLQKMPFEEGNNKVLTARTFHNKVVVYGTRFIEEYSKYFSSDFFITQDGSRPTRYSTVANGIMSYTQFFLFIFGLVAILRKKYSLLPIILLLISPLPSALTTEDSPNLMRSLFMIPFLSIIAGIGFYEIWKINKYYRFLLSFFIVLNSIFFLHMYFVHNSIHEPIPVTRNVGAIEAVSKIMTLENSYDQIVLSNIPDVLYPWYAFYTKPNPSLFNQIAKTRDQGAWSFKNITFSQYKCPTSYLDKFDSKKKIIFIDSEGCDYKNIGNKLKLIYEVKRPEGGIPYSFWALN